MNGLRTVEEGTRRRSASRCLYARKNTNLRSPHRADEMYIGDRVQIFSRTAHAWLPGRVVQTFESDFVHVEYKVGETQLSKVLHAKSNLISFPSIAEGLAHERNQPVPSSPVQQQAAIIASSSSRPSPADCTSKHDTNLQEDSNLQNVYEGDHVQVFSRTALAWLSGEVSRILPDGFMTIHYKVRGNLFCKVLHVESADLSLHQESDPCDEILPGQGCRKEDLPLACRGDPRNYYANMDYIWKLLEGEQVVLVKQSWLLERSVAIPFEPLECRQDLPVEAIIDTSVLRKTHSHYSVNHDSAVAALSHCWLSKDHPDPEGKLLKHIAPFIRSLMAHEAQYKLGACMQHLSGTAFFIAWCSLYQPYHDKCNGAYCRRERSNLTQAQKAAFQKSLECMDIWYTSAQTKVWIVSKDFPCQGKSYGERGWPTWERVVSHLIKGTNAVIDLGISDASNGFSDVLRASPISRDFPMLPDQFDRLIETKSFTAGNADRQLIQRNYRRTFHAALSCCNSLPCSDIKWHYDGFDCIAEILKITTNICHFALARVHIGNVGAVAISTSLQYCQKLQTLDLASNQISDDGACALGNSLQHCKELRALHLESNQIGGDGASALGNGLQHCEKLRKLNLNSNCIGDDGARALGHGLQHCKDLPAQFQPDWRRWCKCAWQ